MNSAGKVTSQSGRVIGEQFYAQLALVQPRERFEREAWVVNTVKIRLLSKLSDHLDSKGRLNLRSVVLTPIFNIDKFTLHIKTNGPELLSLYYRIVCDVLNEFENGKSL